MRIDSVSDLKTREDVVDVLCSCMWWTKDTGMPKEISDFRCNVQILYFL